MAAVNRARVWIGALVGGIVWIAWDALVHMVILSSRYEAAQQAGQFLAAPRYGYFLPVWVLTLLLLSYIAALLYASVRATCGAGPGTALGVGAMVGFAAGFPINFSLAAWSTVDRVVALWWTLDMVVGAIAAALIAGWLYREPAP